MITKSSVYSDGTDKDDVCQANTSNENRVFIQYILSHGICLILSQNALYCNTTSITLSLVDLKAKCVRDQVLQASGGLHSN